VDIACLFCYFAALNPGSIASGRQAIIRSPPLPTEKAERERVTGEITLVQIFVRDNNVDQALKALKKKMQREGSFREMKRHVHYEKPSEKRARQKAEAVRRARKLARKRAQREGLIAAPKKPAPR
jgi:small subunit ribosomal protein S21